MCGPAVILEEEAREARIILRRTGKSAGRSTTAGGPHGRLLAMIHFVAKARSKAAPGEVLMVLTDAEAIRDWSPVPFQLDGADCLRLTTGTSARVSGCLAGRRVGFDVEVHEASSQALQLTAEGPISLDVLYELEPVAGGSEVTASVGLRPGSGLTGRILATAAGALLKGGALDAVAARIARAAEDAQCCLAA